MEGRDAYCASPHKERARPTARTVERETVCMKHTAAGTILGLERPGSKTVYDIWYELTLCRHNKRLVAGSMSICELNAC